MFVNCFRIVQKDMVCQCKIPVCVSLVCTCVDLRWNYTLNKYTLKFCLWRDVFWWEKVLSFRERSGKSAWRLENAHGANIYTRLATLRCCWRQERTLHFILSSSLGSHYTMGQWDFSWVWRVEPCCVALLFKQNLLEETLKKLSCQFGIEGGGCVSKAQGLSG